MQNISTLDARPHSQSSYITWYPEAAMSLMASLPAAQYHHHVSSNAEHACHLHAAHQQSRPIANPFVKAVSATAVSLHVAEPSSASRDQQSRAVLKCGQPCQSSISQPTADGDMCHRGLAMIVMELSVLLHPCCFRLLAGKGDMLLR